MAFTLVLTFLRLPPTELISNDSSSPSRRIENAFQESTTCPCDLYLLHNRDDATKLNLSSLFPNAFGVPKLTHNYSAYD